MALLEADLAPDPELLQIQTVTSAQPQVALIIESVGVVPTTTDEPSKALELPQPAAEEVLELRAPDPAPAPSEPRAEAPAPEPAPFTVVPVPVDETPKALLGQAVGLKLDGVTKVFRSGDAKVRALEDVSMEIGPGEFVAVIGPSGCGKTTLLSLIGGLDRPTSGRVYAAGEILDELSETAMADYRLQRVGTVFQTFNLVESMSALDNVALPLALAGMDVPGRTARAKQLLEMVGLGDRIRAKASRLSGGEQQRVAVARALANRPGLILADEPTGSLDSAAGVKILDLLEELNRFGATVVLVTHDPEVARRAGRAIRMRDGRAIEVHGAGRRNLRNQDAAEPVRRLHWFDSLKLGLGFSGRRPLRTALTTTGVAVGIAAMSLIVALALGLQTALSGSGLASSSVHQVAVHQTPGDGTLPLDTRALTALGRAPHVVAAWGEVSLTGSFTLDSATGASPVGALVALPPLSRESAIPLVAGRMPASDKAPEVLIGDSEVLSLGFKNAADAVGQKIDFTAAFGGTAPAATNPDAVAQPSPQPLTIVGVVPDDLIPADTGGALAPYGFMTNLWSALAAANSWKGSEFSRITLLADSASGVDNVTEEAQRVGFSATTTGDSFRALEELAQRMRLALAGLAVVALLLAGLGIANTMYTAVLERTKEIGVLKAVGARRRDVMLLFVAEAAVIGLAGGLVGSLLAALLARGGNAEIDQVTRAVAGSLDVFRLDAVVVIMAVIGSVMLSTVSGLLPAMRGAVKDPVKALRPD